MQSFGGKQSALWEMFKWQMGSFGIGWYNYKRGFTVLKLLVCS